MYEETIAVFISMSYSQKFINLKFLLFARNIIEKS